MAKVLFLSSFLVPILLLFSCSVRSEILTTGDIKQWCNETPFPKTCIKFMSQSPNNLTKADFRRLATQVALDRAVYMVAGTNITGIHFKHEREKAAWADCLELYDDTIIQLNKTLDHTTKHTDFDAQTWISAALTNLETCRDGFVDLGVSHRRRLNIYKFPHTLFGSVYKMIRNILDLGDDLSNKQTTYKDGFPTWMPSRDRKLLQAEVIVPDIVVAKGVIGNFWSIKEALDVASKRKDSRRFIILVKQGVYEENLDIDKKMKNIMLVGDGLNNTVITGYRSVKGGFSTFKSATVAVTGTGFIARDITFRNTAGPRNGQAVALRSGSDLSVFYRCGFEGYQDTLYTHKHRQFYRECNIYGTVDFIFGNAAVVLQNCTILPRIPMFGQKITITAQGRTEHKQNSGISIHNSRVQASWDPASNNVSWLKTYLGRPWKKYSRTVYMMTFLDSLIDPAGWLEWNGNFALDTLYYGEYNNTGPGSSTIARVNWKGHRIINNYDEAVKFSVGNFIGGQSWLPATNVTFSPWL